MLFTKEPRRNIPCIQTQPLAHGVPSGPGSACAFDRAATVRERLRTSKHLVSLLFRVALESRQPRDFPGREFRAKQTMNISLPDPLKGTRTTISSAGKARLRNAPPLHVFGITLYWNQVLFQDRLVLDNSAF